MNDTITTPATATTSADTVGDSQASGMDKAKGVAVVALAAYGLFTLGRQGLAKLRSKKADKAETTETETKTDE